MPNTATVTYLGRQTVERAIAAYFAEHGTTETVRDELMVMAIQKEDDFFQMIDDFIMKTGLQ